MMVSPRQRILAVDTDPLGLFTLELLLDAMDHRVSVAASCREAVDAIDRVRPVVAVIETRALEAAPDDVEPLGERLSAMEIPVIMLGGRCCEGRSVACQLAAWRQCLKKPLEPRSFAHAVQSAILRRQPGVRG